MGTMIEDQELRDLFQIESEEHIQVIEKCLLSLEKNPQDYDMLHLIFREAHSMKGASRMLGISDIESIAHILEEVLGKASRGEVQITSNHIDIYYEGLDAIKKLVNEAVTGESSGIDVVTVLDRLLESKNNFAPVTDSKGGKPQVITTIEKKETQESKPKEEIIQTPEKEIKSEEKIEEKPKLETPPNSVIKPNPPKEEPINSDIDKIIESKKASVVDTPSAKKEIETDKNKQQVDSKKTDTMRVDSSKLDALMIQTGELIVTKNRILNRVKEVGDAYYSYEELYRTVQETRNILSNFINQNDLSPKHKFFLNQLQEINTKQTEKLEILEENISQLRKNLSNDTTRLSMTSMKIERRIYNLRMLSLSNVFSLFHRTIRDLSRETGKNVQLEIIGGETTIDKQILEEIKDPLMHILRNAVDHGIEAKEERIKNGKPELATITLFGKSHSDTVVIEIKDDGKGLDVEKIKNKALEKGLYSQEELNQMDQKRIFSIIFQHGFSTQSAVSNLSGRGVGMDVVKNFVEKFKGDIETESELGKGTTFRIKLPIKFSTTHILIISVGNQKFGFPTENIVLSKTIHPKDIFILEGRSTVIIEKQPVHLVQLSQYLEISQIKPKKLNAPTPCLFIQSDGMRLALAVDAVIEKNEVIIKSFDGILKKVRNVSGATILDSGEICIVLNPKELMKTITKTNMTVAVETLEIESKKIHALVVDDSLTTRVQIKRILESEGYIVEVGIDGEDGWTKLKSGNFDLVVTDMEMPKLNGLEFTKRIKNSNTYAETPVIILTSLGSEENIKQGMDAGADAYLVKTKFDRKDLLQIVKRLK
ncbi:MAG TPA: hybrid sensor histidine kinase/response regulator [Leptospiraceae bacterium]|nr:hybrid sensor histidine kinase/response regulator [Leptospiraceae bacterium]HMX33564.1 hybrid sensor histidine kinase/response regulator [Leptospiraceae bacterium]HMY33633.1 hybrid sensor histidine kinase/response regulator [Leptospiraceae bacterium]HMZ64118.1 hybrid sensor histidine kinase/response regulator [Leptospiraceae bacterium]HNA09762.1 hybrid sensor histidine kinase/response regulator [Leptospiraceae bacterium]